MPGKWDNLTSAEFKAMLPGVLEKPFILNLLAAEIVLGREFWIESKRDYNVFVATAAGQEPWKSLRREQWESAKPRFRRITWRDVDPMKMVVNLSETPSADRNQSRQVVKKALEHTNAGHLCGALDVVGVCSPSSWIRATPAQETAAAILAVLEAREVEKSPYTQYLEEAEQSLPKWKKGDLSECHQPTDKWMGEVEKS